MITYKKNKKIEFLLKVELKNYHLDADYNYFNQELKEIIKKEILSVKDNGEKYVVIKRSSEDDRIILIRIGIEKDNYDKKILQKFVNSLSDDNSAANRILIPQKYSSGVYSKAIKKGTLELIESNAEEGE